MNKSTSSAEFDFFTEMCEIMGVLNGGCQSSVCALLHQMLECILVQDVYQVSNTLHFDNVMHVRVKWIIVKSPTTELSARKEG